MHCIVLVGEVLMKMDKDKDKQMELCAIKKMVEQLTRDLDTL